MAQAARRAPDWPVLGRLFVVRRITTPTVDPISPLDPCLIGKPGSNGFTGAIFQGFDLRPL